jgi:hypothetical protein
MALDLRAQLLLAGGIDLSGQTTDVSCGSTHRVVYVIVKNGDWQWPLHRSPWDTPP